MKRRYSFVEVINGFIEIDSDHALERDEVIAAIMEGHAYYTNTEYEDIKEESACQ